MSQHEWTRGWRKDYIEQEQNKNEILQFFAIDDSDETCEFSYVYDHGVWKFDDVYLDTYKGVKFEQGVSLILKDPKSAEGFILINNKNLTTDQRKVLRLFFH